MKNPITKFVTIAIMVIIVLGFVPLNGTNVFGHLVNNLTSTLTRLRVLVLNEKVPDVEYVEEQVDKSIKILTSGKLYSSSEISSLEEFLNAQGINFLTEASKNAKYATIPSDKLGILKVFLESRSDYNLEMVMSVLSFAGQEAMLATSFGIAVKAVPYENKTLNLDVAFHDGQAGFEITKIKLNNGAALLISDFAIRQNEKPDKIMLILLIPEMVREQ